MKRQIVTVSAVLVLASTLGGGALFGQTPSTVDLSSVVTSLALTSSTVQKCPNSAEMIQHIACLLAWDINLEKRAQEQEREISGLKERIEMLEKSKLGKGELVNIYPANTNADEYCLKAVRGPGPAGLVVTLEKPCDDSDKHEGEFLGFLAQFHWKVE